MKENSKKAVKVGFFVTSAILLFVILVYFVGSKNNLFNPKTYVYTVFEDVKGVVPGNSVRFSGINVGNVNDIEITSDSTVVVGMSIRKDYAQYIYKNSTVEISQDGLMGNKLLEISGGTANAHHIEENDTLTAKVGINISNTISQVSEMLVTAKSTLENLSEITTKINNGEGDIGELLTNKTLTSKFGATADNLNKTLTQLTLMTQKINAGKGDLGKLMNSNEITDETKSLLTNLNQTVNKANSMVAELSKTTKSINSGDGTLGKLLNDKSTASNVDSAITNANSSLEEVTNTLKKLQNSWIMDLAGDKKKNYPTEKK